MNATGQTVDADSANGVASEVVLSRGSWRVRVRTLPDGHLAFADVREGQYSISATAAGYVGGRFGQRHPVCRLFQISATESRSLIRAVMSKYQYALKSAIERSMKKAVEAATAGGDGEPFTVTINSLNVVDELNRALAEIDGSLQPVAKRRGSVSTFEISPASHGELKKYLGM